VKTPNRSWPGWPLIASSVVVVAGVYIAQHFARLNADIERRISRNQASVSEIPQFGSLSGRNSTTIDDWEPRLPREPSSSIDLGATHAAPPFVLLFPVNIEARIESIQYWRDVAQAVPEVQFVGVCFLPAPCDEIPKTHLPIMVLTSMDPVQMRALTVARSAEKALLFHGEVLREALVVSADRNILSRNLISSVQRSKALDMP
jgi:hypothetical protein